jgi:hypothetical protein
MAPTTAAAMTTSITRCKMAPITDPTIRNAISMPTPMAATLNQRIRRIPSRQGTVLSRDITRLWPGPAERRASTGPNRPLR